MQLFCNKMYFITEKKICQVMVKIPWGDSWLTVPICDFFFPQQGKKEILYLGGNVLKQIIMFKDYLLEGVAQGIIMLSIE